ncbi:hypothetical protein DFH07DRAFT_958101 [Mycena maculata]|uniref:Uncharacterized protein n=1 Tax=Mycena maculata TaxID=230809 RepID=A0AAD7JAC8_9AGAR|nr:hypothetical protein DFH07DRAFT_958101 [Mycena maculata]
MSSNAGTSNGQVAKRRRENTAGGSIPTSTFYNDGSTSSTTFTSSTAPSNTATGPKAVTTDQYGAVWQHIYSELVAGKHAIPSPNMVANFAEIHLKSLNNYKGAQSSLQRATATSNGFSLSSSGGPPPVVTNHLKLPTYQLVKSAPGVDSDPRVTEALKAASETLSAVHDAATTLLSTVYTVQMEHCRQQINIGACADRFAADLTAYSRNVVHMSGFEDRDRYMHAVDLLKSAFMRELEDLAIDFTAKLIKSSALKEAKAVTLANARADAEMSDATKPVAETIGDEVKRLFAAQLPTLINTLKKSVPTRTTAPASKNPSSSSSTKKTDHKSKDPKPKPKTAQAAKGTDSNPKVKQAGNRANGGGTKQAELSNKGKGKGKATEESLDSDAT